MQALTGGAHRHLLESHGSEAGLFSLSQFIILVYLFRAFSDGLTLRSYTAFPFMMFVKCLIFSVFNMLIKFKDTSKSSQRVE